MLRRLALLTLLGAAGACNAPPPAKKPAPPAPQEKQAPAPLSRQQIDERTETCGKRARDEYRRDWQDGIVTTADGHLAAEFASHYNAKLDTCFYLLTVSRFANRNGQADVPAETLLIKLFDLGDGELYGEYSGPAAADTPAVRSPATCRVDSFFCASRGEWEVLLEPYMED
jgi:hypothetical protein